MICQTDGPICNFQMCKITKAYRRLVNGLQYVLEATGLSPFYNLHLELNEKLSETGFKWAESCIRAMGHSERRATFTCLLYINKIRIFVQASRGDLNSS